MSSFSSLTLFCRSITLFISFGFIFSINAGEVSPSYAVQGGIGLWQTPTARMGSEGDLAVSYTDNQEYRFWSATLQLFPWMESTVRYADVRTRLYSNDPGFSGDQTLKDKGIDVKFRLLEEDFYLPEFSIGFRDIGGTGLFASEFMAASKTWGPLDFHLGLGWGYLGTGDDFTNPFCQLKESFCEREAGYSGNGGKIEFGKFFHGNTSLFGGIEYQTPVEGLTLKLEYEGKTYVTDRAGNLPQDSHWNVGAVYRWRDFDFNMNYQRGNTFGFGVSYKMNLHTAKQVKIDEPPRALFNPNVPENMESVDRARLYRALQYDAGFVLSAVNVQSNEMAFYGTQLNYRDDDEATQRIGRIIASELPDSIKRYKIVENVGTNPMLETVIDADSFKLAARLETLENDISSSYVRSDTSRQTLDQYHPNKTSGLFYGMESFWIQSFGSPEDFYLYQGGLFFTGGYTFNSNLSMRGSLKVNVVENFDKFTFTVDNLNTPLPRVRTLVKEYVSRSRVTMESAFVHWFDRLGKNTYAQAYAGYLETMFGGVGGEIMYRPVDSNVFFGLDLNYVQQRSYENDWDFFDYKVLTGHANIYWRPSFMPDTQFTVNIGQFLAKDKGVNIDFAKRFDSGVIVGAYAALTNVSADEYGEGSFTKGFYLSIPFDLFVVEPATGRGKFPWVPIGRDGGQKLLRPVELRSLTELRSPFYD
jgi:hypothetical protein